MTRPQQEQIEPFLSQKRVKPFLLSKEKEQYRTLMLDLDSKLKITSDNAQRGGSTPLDNTVNDLESSFRVPDSEHSLLFNENLDDLQILVA